MRYEVAYRLIDRNLATARIYFASRRDAHEWAVAFVRENGPESSAVVSIEGWGAGDVVRYPKEGATPCQ
jgi:hypothetical protein